MIKFLPSSVPMTATHDSTSQHPMIIPRLVQAPPDDLQHHLQPWTPYINYIIDLPRSSFKNIYPRWEASLNSRNTSHKHYVFSPKHIRVPLETEFFSFCSVSLPISCSFPTTMYLIFVAWDRLRLAALPLDPGAGVLSE